MVYVPILGLNLEHFLIKTVLAYYLLTRKEEIGMWVVQILERHCLCPLPINKTIDFSVQLAGAQEYNQRNYQELPEPA